MDRGAWQATVHEITKSRKGLGMTYQLHKNSRYKHNSKLWQLDAATLSAEGAWRCQSLPGVPTASVTAHCKTNAACYFCVLSYKRQSVLGFLQLEKTDANVGFVKAMWHKADFQKAGYTCTAHGFICFNCMWVSGK